MDLFAHYTKHIVLLIFCISVQFHFAVPLHAQSYVSIDAGLFHALGLKNDGTLWAWGYNDSGQLGDGSTTFRTQPKTSARQNNQNLVVIV